MKTRKIAYCALLTTAALVLSYVEALIPIPFPIPGMKLGLANLAIVLVLYLYSTREALIVSFVRILIVGFLFGNVMSIAFSLAGGMLSLLVMVLLKKTDWFPVTGVSMIGGVTHNLGQLLVAMVVVQSVKLGYYFAVLMITGAVTGLLIGFLASRLLKTLKTVPDRI